MESAVVPVPSADIVFDCRHCAAPLVVDAAAAGMTVDCQRCTKPTIVPAASEEVPAIAALSVDPRHSELQRLLKENDSQRVEITSYINQLCIQLHRWKLRLQTLNERKQQLESELPSDAA